MLIGTAETNTTAVNVDCPADLKVSFIEDQNLSEQDVAALTNEVRHQGFKNIGNTCYMNSVIQALRASPEFVSAVTSYSGTDKLVRALGSTYRELDKGVSSVVPAVFWKELCRKYTQFGERTEEGYPKQHDAEECMTCLLSSMSSAGIKEIDLFEGKLVTRRHCLETDAEPDSVSSDTFRKLECHIDNTISFLMPGLKLSLQGQVEKHSQVLGREALYSTDTRIEKLPYYLNVQFMRFFWKASIGSRAKIVRPVQFPMELDVLDICSQELAEKVKVVRTYDRILEDKKNGLESLDKAATEKILATPEDVIKKVPFTNQTGLYELAAIVTHIGMSADGGHYIGWVREKEGWFKFDDDKVTPVSESDIAKVDGRGGAQGHIAYVAIYRTKPRAI